MSSRGPNGDDTRLRTGRLQVRVLPGVSRSANSKQATVFRRLGLWDWVPPLAPCKLFTVHCLLNRPRSPTGEAAGSDPVRCRFDCLRSAPAMQGAVSSSGNWLFLVRSRAPGHSNRLRIQGPRSPTGEAAGSDPVQCWFDSSRRHHSTPTWPNRQRQAT